MKKTIFTFIILCISYLALAQEPNETEFKIAIGDTIVWRPFTDCLNLDYNVSGSRVINYHPVHYGEKIEIVANKVGNCSITATCQNNNTTIVASITVIDPSIVPVVVEKPVKPETQPFTGTFSFTPPTDNYFITINDTGSGFNETYMKHGDDEAYNDGQGVDRFWNVKTGKNWYYRPDAQGWTDDVDWEFEAFGESFPIINSFANEVNKDNLSNYYVGMEKVLDMDCWHFFVDFEDGTVIQYWVDPANGCTLKKQINANPAKVVTVYDLKYNRLYFGPSFKKGLHDTTR